MLRLENVRARVEEREVLKGISLSLREGEVLYVLGLNGCGKTSLRRAISGYPGYKGFSREEAEGILVRGLMNVELGFLPERLQKYVSSVSEMKKMATM